jgi:hypothetical protein
MQNARVSRKLDFSRPGFGSPATTRIMMPDTLAIVPHHRDTHRLFWARFVQSARDCASAEWFCKPFSNRCRLITSGPGRLERTRTALRAPRLRSASESEGGRLRIAAAPHDCPSKVSGTVANQPDCGSNAGQMLVKHWSNATWPSRIAAAPHDCPSAFRAPRHDASRPGLQQPKRKSGADQV